MRLALAAAAALLLLASCSSLPSNTGAPVIAEVRQVRDQAAEYLKSGDESVRKRVWSQAENYYQLALTSYESVDSLAGEYAALDSLGFLYLGVQKIDAAGASWSRAYDLAAQTGDKKLLARAASNLGRLALAQGDAAGALKRLDDALALREGLDGSVVAVMLHTRALALKALDRGPEALKALDEAVALNDKAGALQEQASNLYLAASLLSKSGSPDEAIKKLETALELDKRAENSDGIAGDLVALATLLSRRAEAADKTKAQAYALRAYRVSLAADDVAGVTKALKLLVEVSTALGDQASVDRYQALLAKL